MRELSFIAILVAWWIDPIVFMAICIIHAGRFPLALELLGLAVVLDGYFGLALHWNLPFYTLITGAVLVVVEWIRPLIARYNTSDIL